MHQEPFGPSLKHARMAGARWTKLASAMRLPLHRRPFEASANGASSANAGPTCAVAIAPPQVLVPHEPHCGDTQEVGGIVFEHACALESASIPNSGHGTDIR